VTRAVLLLRRMEAPKNVNQQMRQNSVTMLF
jgi:hypothetical protein